MRPRSLPPTDWVFDPARWPEDDCVAAGADLQPATILAAYAHSAFPMPHEGELFWFSPLERGVLEPGNIRITKSLRTSMRHFTTTTDEAFEAVIDACADPSRPGAWIDADIRAAYVRLHELGWAHSVEVRDRDGRLAGGLYGVCLGRLFVGESMFHRQTDASKAALVALVDWLDDGVDRLIDVQWPTPHLVSLGVTVWSRERYRKTILGLSGPPFPEIWA